MVGPPSLVWWLKKQRFSFWMCMPKFCLSLLSSLLAPTLTSKFSNPLRTVNEVEFFNMLTLTYFFFQILFVNYILEIWYISFCCQNGEHYQLVVWWGQRGGKRHCSHTCLMRRKDTKIQRDCQILEMHILFFKYSNERHLKQTLSGHKRVINKTS